jgi:oxygen-independent coproporphyrinogen-3 oxidase
MAQRLGLESVVDWGRVDRLVASGHLRRIGDRIALTGKGRLVLDAILGEIAAAEPISADSEPLRVSLPA